MPGFKPQLWHFLSPVLASGETGANFLTFACPVCLFYRMKIKNEPYSFFAPIFIFQLKKTLFYIGVYASFRCITTFFICIYLFFFNFSHLGYYRILNRVPIAIWGVLVGYLF